MWLGPLKPECAAFCKQTKNSTVQTQQDFVHCSCLCSAHGVRACVRVLREDQKLWQVMQIDGSETKSPEIIFLRVLAKTHFLFCISITLDSRYTHIVVTHTQTHTHTNIIGYVGSRANLHLSLPWLPERLIFLEALTHIPSVIHLFVHSFLLLAFLCTALCSSLYVSLPLLFNPFQFPPLLQ